MSGTATALNTTYVVEGIYNGGTNSLYLDSAGNMITGKVGR